MHTEPHLNAAQVAHLAESRALKAFAAVALLMAAIFAAYWPTTVSMIETWAQTETYNHCFLVIPAVLWFVWTLRARLAASPVAPCWLGLVPLAGAGALWLTGELASSLAPTHWAVVLTVPFAVLALYGVHWARILAFPLAFLLFAVPFGEALTPTLIDWTADFTVAALGAVGVPVFREGQHFVIPSGRWSVVEACSGIRYLMASVVVGVLYAWMMYRSPIRRSLFIGAAVVVPIIANWMRAFLIVMIGHLSSNRLAVGVDHIIYGWVFFGVVIGALFWVGARWREDHEPDVRPLLPVDVGVSGTSLRPAAPILAAVVALVVVWPLAGIVLLGVKDGRPLQPATVQAAGAWTDAPNRISSWTPELKGTTGTQSVAFSSNGTAVTVFTGWYRDQRQGRELVNSMNVLVAGKGPATLIARGSSNVRFGGDEVSVRTATIRNGEQRLRIWQWYWVGDRVETSDTRAKLALALDRLLTRTDTSAWIAISTEAETDAAGDSVLGNFVKEMGPSLKAALQETERR